MNFQPYLSVVVTTRNDNHGHNPLIRTQAFLDGVAWHANRTKLPVEVIFVEWNPPLDREPLQKVLTWPEPTEFFHSRIITVPNAIHTRYKGSHFLPLYQMIAKNVGIRRARGEFVLATNIDILFSVELMDYFSGRPLTSGYVYRTDRIDTPPEAALQHTPEAQLAFAAQNIIRANYRTGSLAVNPDLALKRDEHDITPVDGSIKLGQGWYGVIGGGHAASPAYRWMASEGEMFLSPPPGKSSIDVAFFSLAIRPFTIQAFCADTRAVIAETIIQPGQNRFSFCNLPRKLLLRCGAIVRDEQRLKDNLNYEDQAICIQSFSWGDGEGLSYMPASESASSAKSRAATGLHRKFANVVKRNLYRAYWTRLPREARIRGTLQALPHHLHTNASGDFQLAAKSDWEKLFGYAELHAYSMHLDSLMEFTFHYGGVKEKVLDPKMVIYHIEHSFGSGWTPEGGGALESKMKENNVDWLEYSTVIHLAGNMRFFGIYSIFDAMGFIPKLL